MLSRSVPGKPAIQKGYQRVLDGNKHQRTSNPQSVSLPRAASQHWGVMPQNKGASPLFLQPKVTLIQLESPNSHYSSSYLLVQHSISHSLFQSPRSLLVSSSLLQSPPISSSLLQSPTVSSSFFQSRPVSSSLLQSHPMSVLHHPPVPSSLFKSPPVTSSLF